MPYIAPKDRTKLDPLIDKLADEITDQAKEYGYDGAFAGLLNYVCTRLALQLIKKGFGKARYWLIAITSGTFHNIADEFYRRFGVPYENVQIKKNGDVDLYSEFDQQLK
jgi:uncharacterized membrane-anchored protein